jgi:hypothetical protein
MKVWKPPVSSCTCAQLEQVVDAVLVVLDVPIEHGALDLMPILCARRAVVSHSLPSILWSQMIAARAR